MPTTEHASAGDQSITADRRTEIAAIYASLLHQKHGDRHDGAVKDMHLSFADAILARDAYGLKHLSYGGNEVAKAAFTQITGLALPKTQGLTWVALRQWAGVSDKADAHAQALRKVATEARFLQVSDVAESRAWISGKIAEGYTTLKSVNHRWFLLNDQGTGYDLSRKGTGMTQLRPLLEAELALAKAAKELAAERAALDGVENGDDDHAGQHERPRG